MGTSNKSEILNKGAGVFLIRVIGYGAGFLFVWVVANKFGPKIQGIFSIAFLFLSVGAMVAKFGIETALVKWIANASTLDQKKGVYLKSIKLVSISSVLVGGTIYLLAGAIAWMYDKPDLKESIEYASMAIPFLALLDVSGSFFRGERRIKIFGIYFHFLKFLLPLLFVTAFFLAGGLFNEAPILAYLMGLFLAAFSIITHIGVELRHRGNEVESQFTIRFMVLESYPMMVSSAIVMIMGWSDVFVLGFYVSMSNIGVYSTAIKLATMVSFVYNAIATIATPKIAAFYNSKDRMQLEETISYSSKIMFLSGIPMFLAIFCFPEFFLSFFGEEYVAGKHVLRILLLAQLTNVVTGPVGPIMQMTGKQRKLQRFIAIALFVNVALSLILVVFYETVGVAIANALGMVLWNVLGMLYIRKKLKLKTYYSFK
ncbi:flippase [Flagellimonas meishanensis]|uniref:flippase n=1 Tax=Flagellimonas meishanensis TaxID=2873264 RepID=UPI001CA642D7|nr:flippase [[Muricauda] meishanensis]